MANCIVRYTLDPFSKFRRPAFPARNIHVDLTCHCIAKILSIRLLKFGADVVLDRGWSRRIDGFFRKWNGHSLTNRERVCIPIGCMVVAVFLAVHVSILLGDGGNLSQKPLDVAWFPVGGLWACGHLRKTCSIVAGKKPSPMEAVPASRYFGLDSACLSLHLSSRWELSGLPEAAIRPL